MNERIKELLKQSTKEVFKYGGSGKAPGEYYSNYEYVVDHEKFAELIVKETLQVARAGMEFGDSMDEAVYTYFGVK